MKKNGFWKGFGSGLVLTALVVVLGVTATATSKRSIQVEDGIGITLNGATFIPRSANGKQVSVFLYNGTTYVPVRAISEAMGMDVSFNSATRTVVLTTADRTASQQGASSDYITAERAKQIALNDAGVKESAAVFLRANLDWDDGRMHYEVEFYSGSTEYDYDIDAVTGAILSSDRDMEDFQIWNGGTSRPSGSTSSSGSSNSGNYITAERAKQIALAECPSGSTVVKCQFDWDDGRAQYEVEIRNGWTEYDFEIDAVTGTIFSRDIDNDRYD